MDYCDFVKDGVIVNNKLVKLDSTLEMAIEEMAKGYRENDKYLLSMAELYCFKAFARAVAESELTQTEFKFLLQMLRFPKKFIQYYDGNK